MNMNATYSPEDNKLRLYSVSRLPKELYERVRSAGFIWAPKQELFVAPAWTPAREDLLLELCGEVGDEDSSLVDRAEQRAERFEDYGERRSQDAERAKAAVDAIADNIPLGQPILVGHHSEKHARRDAEKIENGMRKAVKMWETSQYWLSRAKGAIHAAKYKELPTVRARRIKKIEADKREQEREKARLEQMLRFWRGEMKKKDGTPFEVNRENAMRFCNGHDHGGVTLPDGTQEWSAWSALDRNTATVEYIQARRLASLPPSVERCNRWLGHYDNRLAYEQAMLGESGGIATDKVKPEKGGACKCWASPRGGWSYIKKVNKVSVTVEDNWGNGGQNFTRVIPFDKLSALMTKAQVDEARTDPKRFAETTTKDGFFLATEAPTEPKPAKVPDEKEAAFDAMKDSLKARVKVVTAPQLFPTPPQLADLVVGLAEVGVGEGLRVLEPSAGTGNLIAAVRQFNALCPIVAVEHSVALADALRARYSGSVDTRCADFLECGDLGTFDRIVMNPPFANGADIKHIEHARKMLKPGGRLVAICANGPRQQEKLKPQVSQWVDLPPDVFAEQGTSVNTALVIIDN
jgi:protein-L-isoaspartate O-methyltransferase